MSARIEDLAYARYDGPRRGTTASVLSLARWSALSALGRRRSWRTKIIPIVIVLLAAGPALAVLGVRAIISDRLDEVLSADQSPADFLRYQDYYQGIGLLMFVFAAVIAPELLCGDRRDRVLTLYFSTAVSRFEYVIAKLLAAIVPMGLVTLLPVLILFVGNVLFESDPTAYLTSHLGDLVRIIAAGFALAIYYAVVALAVASLTGRRAIALGGYAILMVGSGAIGGIISSLTDSTLLGVVNLPLIPLGLVQSLWVDPTPFDPSRVVWVGAWLLVVAASLAVIAIRYRRAGA